MTFENFKNKVRPYLHFICAIFHQGKDIVGYIKKYVPQHPELFKQLEQFKNIHKGKRCFIVATGPSLTIEDVNKLKGEICWTCNSGIKLLKVTDWKPTYYALSDGVAFKVLKDILGETDIPCTFYNEKDIDWSGKNRYPLPMWVNLFLSTEDRLALPWSWRKHRMSYDITKKVFMCSSVVHVIIQICVYMGFNEIYLLGCDCTNPFQHSSVADFSQEELENNVDFRRADYNCYTFIEDYKVAKKFAEKHGVRIYNATRGGNLEVFERVDLDKVLQS